MWLNNFKASYIIQTVIYIAIHENTSDSEILSKELKKFLWKKDALNCYTLDKEYLVLDKVLSSYALAHFFESCLLLSNKPFNNVFTKTKEPYILLKTKERIEKCLIPDSMTINLIDKMFLKTPKEIEDDFNLKSNNLFKSCKDYIEIINDNNVLDTNSFIKSLLLELLTFIK